MFKEERIEKFARMYTFAECGDEREESFKEETFPRALWIAFCKLSGIDSDYGYEYYQTFPEAMKAYLQGEDNLLASCIESVIDEIPIEAINEIEYRRTLDDIHKRIASNRF